MDEIDENAPIVAAEVPLSPLDNVWTSVSFSLIKLEQFVESPAKYPWKITEGIAKFTDIYHLCTDGDTCMSHEAQLYDRYENYLVDYLSQRVFPHAIADRTDEDLLCAVVSRWKGYRDIFIRFCGKLFSYLDRYYTITSRKPPLRDLGYDTFRSIIFARTKNTMSQVILRMIEQDRLHGLVNKILLRDAIALFVDLGMYESDLEHDIIAASNKFHAKQTQTWLEQNSLTEYFILAEKLIQEEYNRILSIFPGEYQQKLIRICDWELLVVPKSQLFSGNALESLIRQNKFSDLSRIHRVMNRVEGGIAPITDTLRAFIERQGRDILSKPLDIHDDNKSDFHSFVQALIKTYILDCLTLQDNMRTLVNNAFSNGLPYQTAMAEAFKSFSNDHFTFPFSRLDISMAQLFAYYCDDILRNDALNNLDELLERAVKYVVYFKDKDIFIEEHRKQMSKRLLGAKHDRDGEEKMIAKLKENFRGMGDLYKLEKMISDKELASEMRQQFVDYLKLQEVDLGFELQVQVLTTGTWPIAANKEHLQPPAELARGHQFFSHFYTRRHQRRVLTWVYSRDSVQLLARFAGKEKTLETTAFQASILLLFKDPTTLSLTVDDICTATGLSREFALKVLAPISSSKLCILQQIKCDEISPGKSEYAVNPAFTNQKRIIKLPLVRVTEEESEKTQSSIAGDRLFVLDAAIVRIMKTRKVMRLQDLTNETMIQVNDRFHPNPKTIKKRIESLMERDFLQRNSGDMTMIEYLA